MNTVSFICCFLDVEQENELPTETEAPELNVESSVTPPITCKCFIT